MNEKDTQNEQLESILKRAHLPEPSPELKEQITAEAAKVWNQTSPELSWQIPVRRLLVSAAAALFVIWLANCSSDYALARWRPGGPPVAHQQPPDLDALPELSYSPLARHLVSAGRKPSMTNASALRSYTETMLRILNEAQQNGVSKPPTPAEGRSRLLPTQPSLNSYS
jgi:predicted YcjX-like family ATPase